MTWELDRLLWARSVENLATATTTLTSLALHTISVVMREQRDYGSISLVTVYPLDTSWMVEFSAVSTYVS